MKNIQIHAAFLLIFILLGCRKTIDIPELNHTPQLVAKAALGTDQDQILVVFSESKGILEGGGINYLGQGVLAKIWANDEELATPRVEIIDYIYQSGDNWFDPGTYDTVYAYIWDHKPQSGIEYRLEAQHNGRSITAKTVVPQPALISDVSLTNPERNTYNFNLTHPQPNKIGHYRMKISGDNEFESNFPIPFSVLNDPSIENWELDGFDFEEPGYENTMIYGHFTTRKFKNNRKNISFRPSFNWGNTMHLVIYHMEPIMYEYLNKTAINLILGENPFAEPVFVPSNINGGMGLFTSYALTSKEL